MRGNSQPAGFSIAIVDDPSSRPAVWPGGPCRAQDRSPGSPTEDLLRKGSAHPSLRVACQASRVGWLAYLTLTYLYAPNGQPSLLA